MNEIGQDRRAAREMTEEIDRATDGGVFERAAEESHELGRETAENLGGKILAYGAEQQRKNERVYEMAEVDNGYGKEMMPGVSQVGEESGRQIAEREAWDAENRRNEDNPKRDYEAQIMARDQSGIARDMADRVEKITRQREFGVRDLEMLRLRASASMREAYENPYKLGERN